MSLWRVSNCGEIVTETVLVTVARLSLWRVSNRGKIVTDSMVSTLSYQIVIQNLCEFIIITTITKHSTDDFFSILKVKFVS